MNLILLERDELEGRTELGATGELTLGDRRAEHLAKVLRASPGDRVRVGVVDGPQGHAEILALDRRQTTLRFHLDAPAPPPGRDVLLLAFARPKVLLRCLEHATALGFGRIVVFRSRRVERSHLSSRAVDPTVIGGRLRRGLEQARRTWLPEVVLVPRFRELIEERVDSLATRTNRFVADPDAADEVAERRLEPAELTLAIGPEGGLSDHEIAELGQRGFSAVRAGRAPLRVETAVAYLAGQLRAVRDRPSPKG